MALGRTPRLDTVKFEPLLSGGDVPGHLMPSGLKKCDQYKLRTLVAWVEKPKPMRAPVRYFFAQSMRINLEQASQLRI